MADGIKAVAIVFMHAYRYPEHEKAVAKLARDMGFPQVSVSHEISPLIKLVGRGDTTVVDAYLSPILRRYVATVRMSCARVAPQRPLPRLRGRGQGRGPAASTSCRHFPLPNPPPQAGEGAHAAR